MKCLSLNFEASEMIKICPVKINRFPWLSAIDFSSLGQRIYLMMMTAQSKALGGSRICFGTLPFGPSGGAIYQQFQWPRLLTYMEQGGFFTKATAKEGFQVGDHWHSICSMLGKTVHSVISFLQETWGLLASFIQAMKAECRPINAKQTM